MFVQIRNTPLGYAWGADRAISTLLGTDGVCLDPGDHDGPRPEAELWMGAHPGSPSLVVDPSQADGARDLADWIACDPDTVLGRFARGLRDGDGPRLPFLLKVLAAGAPLSLQAHPSLDRARAGFAAEDARGVRRDAPDRNYRDPSHKPELLLALSETMEALVGFRSSRDTASLVASLAEAAEGDAPSTAALAPLVRRTAHLDGPDALRDVVTWILTPSAEMDAVVAAVSELALRPGPAIAWRTRRHRERETVADLAERFPGDAGIVLALLLNRVTLRRGEAIFVQAGSLHAYLHGTGIEIMAASDNVLRGGLTPKHVDRDELLASLDYAPVPPPYLAPIEIEPGVREFRPDVSDFRLVHLSGGGRHVVRVDGPAMVLALSGAATVTGASGGVPIVAGECLYVTPDEGDLAVEGDVELVVAMPGLDRDDAAPIAADRR